MTLLISTLRTSAWISVRPPPRNDQSLHVFTRPTAGTGAATALLVGVGAAGGETARLCQALGMRTLGIDARRTEPHPFIDELYGQVRRQKLMIFNSQMTIFH